MKFEKNKAIGLTLACVCFRVNSMIWWQKSSVKYRKKNYLLTECWFQWFKFLCLLLRSPPPILNREELKLLKVSSLSQKPLSPSQSGKQNKNNNKKRKKKSKRKVENLFRTRRMRQGGGKEALIVDPRWEIGKNE